MIIIDVEQRSPEWLALRRGAITASAADRLATPAKLREYALELAAERLVRAMPEQRVTEAMQWGIDHEDEARMRYAFEVAHVEVIGFAWHDDHQGWAGCSPDGLVGDRGLVEIKCPTSKRHLEYLSDGVVPKDYLAQLDFQLWVSGRDWCDFVSYDPRFERGEFFVVRHHRDMERMVAIGKQVDACVTEIQRRLAALGDQA